jgi:hypothetical protein
MGEPKDIAPRPSQSALQGLYSLHRKAKMPLKKLFQNIHGFGSQPSAPFVFMVTNPDHTPKHKLPYP